MTAIYLPTDVRIAISALPKSRDGYSKLEMLFENGMLLYRVIVKGDFAYCENKQDEILLSRYLLKIKSIKPVNY